MRRIDCNACFGHWQYWDLPHKSPDDLLRLMDRHEIEWAVILSLRGVVLDWQGGNTETLAAVRAHPDRFVAAATISPFCEGGAAALRSLADEGVRVVRLYPGFHSYSLDSAFVDEICAAAEANVVVMIPTRPMMNWRFKPIALSAIGRVVARHPKTTFLMSGPNYLAEYQALVRMMTANTNVLYEISCLQGFNGICNLLQVVGAERVLFGTGAVLNYPACNVAKLDHAQIADSQRRAIASENAAALFGV